MSQPDWSEAPYTATHYHPNNKFAKWYRRSLTAWEYFDTDVDGWLKSGDLDRLQGAEKILIPRPVTDCPYLPCPDDATHTQNGTCQLYKAGPNRNAQVWNTSKPGWVRTSATKNEDLDDPTKFAPIIRNHLPTPTNSEVIFTMSEDQAKELALDKRPMKVVEVRFQRAEGAKTYHYYAPADAKSGDFAVVYANDNIVNGRDFPFTVVQITNDEVIDTQRATKAILGTFNEDFARHVQARIEHMARVKAKLQQKKKQFEESAFFEMLAKSDPEAASLLDELKSFNL